MEYVVALLVKYGYWGMFVSAFVAGSFFPFSSEAVMTGLELTGLSVWKLMLFATLGNTLGGMFNYAVGHIGNEEWIYRILKVRADRLERCKNFVHNYGAWMGLLSWLPILGSIITIAMGLLRVNVWFSTLTIFIGKAARYAALAYILQQV